MELITVKQQYGLDDDYENDLTKEMDKHLLKKHKDFKSYICKGNMALRYPGATRGHIEIDDNMVIVDIVLYDTACDNIVKCYKSTIREVIKKFIGAKIIFK